MKTKCGDKVKPKWLCFAAVSNLLLMLMCIGQLLTGIYKAGKIIVEAKNWSSPSIANNLEQEADKNSAFTVNEPGLNLNSFNSAVDFKFSSDIYCEGLTGCAQSVVSEINLAIVATFLSLTLFSFGSRYAWRYAKFADYELIDKTEALEPERRFWWAVSFTLLVAISLMFIDFYLQDSEYYERFMETVKSAGGPLTAAISVLLFANVDNVYVKNWKKLKVAPKPRQLSRSSKIIFWIGVESSSVEVWTPFRLLQEATVWLTWRIKGRPLSACKVQVWPGFRIKAHESAWPLIATSSTNGMEKNQKIVKTVCTYIQANYVSETRSKDALHTTDPGDRGTYTMGFANMCVPVVVVDGEISNSLAKSIWGFFKKDWTESLDMEKNMHFFPIVISNGRTWCFYLFSPRTKNLSREQSITLINADSLVHLFTNLLRFRGVGIQTYS